MRPSMRALVTGGAGFIGSNLVDALLDRGDEVVIVDNLSTGREVNLTSALERGASLERADIRDAAAMREVMATARPAAVFHLAAQIDVRRSVSDPDFDARTNVEGTVNLLEAAREADVGRFVNTSSGGAIYGGHDGLPPPEPTLPAPMAPYRASKYAAAGYCGPYERLHRVSVAPLPYRHVYGERPEPPGEGRG